MNKLQYFLLLTLNLSMTNELLAYDYSLVCGTKNVDVKTEAALMLIGGAESGSSSEKNATSWVVDRARGGDYLVLRVGGIGQQAGWMCDTFSRIEVNSASELSVDSKEDANNPMVIDYINKAEIIFIAGGDQNKYEDYWKGSKLNEALNIYMLSKPIMGTSAGMAILSQSYYSPDGKAMRSSDILNNPYDETTKDIFYQDFLLHPFMKSVITDTHINRVEHEETRHGRLFGLLARSMMDNPDELGFLAVGLEEETFLAIDKNWKGMVFGQKAYFLQAVDKYPNVMKGSNNIYWNNSGKAVAAYVIQGQSNGYGQFDFKNWINVKGGLWQAWYTTGGESNFACSKGC